MDSVNLYDHQLEYDDSDPDGFRCGTIHATRLLGAQALAVKGFLLPAGQRLCPYHYEYDEEWLIVLEGSVDVRTPDGTRTLRRGDVMQYPAGPAGAHNVANAGPDSARIVMFSTARQPSVAVYPDSDKIGVWTGNEDDHVMLRRRDGHVDYWDGEHG